MSGTQYRPVLAVALLFTIGTLMGLTSNLVKLASGSGWQPMAFLLWSLLGGGLLLLLFAWLRGERPGMSLPQQRYYLASGLLSIAVPNALLFSSIGHVGAGFASMCLAFPPLITYLLALALRMEGLSRIRLLGICIGLSGSLLLALGKLNSGDSPTLWVLGALSVPVFLALGAPLTGLLTQLYQVRSRRSWGIGDLGDLARLGVTPGPETGRLLKAFEAGWIADDFPSEGHEARLRALMSPESSEEEKPAR